MTTGSAMAQRQESKSTFRCSGKAGRFGNVMLPLLARTLRRCLFHLVVCDIAQTVLRAFE
jgi:hypothetical protein